MNILGLFCCPHTPSESPYSSYLSFATLQSVTIWRVVALVQKPSWMPKTFKGKVNHYIQSTSHQSPIEDAESEEESVTKKNNKWY